MRWRSVENNLLALDFNVPKITKHENDRVDLRSFGESLGEVPDNKFELALNEFFAKGIIGILMNTNNQYVNDNLSREKVFL